MVQRRLQSGLGASIRLLRKRLDLTQSRLAERLGVTPHSVSQWERESQQPSQWSIWNMHKIASEAGLRNIALFLAGGLGEMFRDPARDPKRVKEVYDARQRELRQPRKKARGQHKRYPSFAKRLHDARQSLNLDPVDFCSLHGIDPRAYSDWEAGVSQPDLYSVGKLIKAFGRDSTFILYEMDLTPEDIRGALP